MTQFKISVYDASGVQKSAVSAVPAASITGQVATANGGTGQNWGASSGIPLLTAGTGSLLTAPSGALVGDTDTQTLTNKSLQDSTTYFIDDGDTSKKVQLQLSGITPATTRTLTIPDRSATLATLTGDEVFTGAKDYNGATMRVPVTAAALTATEGYWKWDSTDKVVKFYDGTRERALSWGYQTLAAQVGFTMTAAFSSSNTLAAISGTLLFQIIVTGHMLVEAVTLLNNDTATQRTWGWDLYVDLNNASNSVTRCATSNGNETFTPIAASTRTLAVSSAPVYLPPGSYFLAIQNRHATSTFALGVSPGGGNFTATQAKTKTTGGANGATLDIIAATWTTTSQTIGANLRGRVAADTVAW